MTNTNDLTLEEMKEMIAKMETRQEKVELLEQRLKDFNEYYPIFLKSNSKEVTKKYFRLLDDNNILMNIIGITNIEFVDILEKIKKN